MRHNRTAATLAASLTPVLLGVAALAACSSGSPSAEATATAPAATATGRGGGGGQRQPGVSGIIAAVSGSTMQLQSQSRQTAVSWTATTAFTKAQAGSAADVTVGACVAVRSAGGATATGDSVSAANVQIAPAAADGTCSLGFAGGTPPVGAPNGVPRSTDAPSDAPSGGGPGQGGSDGRGGAGGAGLFGKVTAVSGASFTLARIMPAGEGATSTATPATVTTTSSTAYTTLVKATATDVVVGQCATAQGQTSETGALTATSVALRAPVGGSCFGAGASSTAGGATGG